MRPAELTILRAGAQVLGTMPDGLGQFVWLGAGGCGDAELAR
jgi:hypothetical protein